MWSKNANTYNESNTICVLIYSTKMKYTNRHKFIRQYVIKKCKYTGTNSTNTIFELIGQISENHIASIAYASKLFILNKIWPKNPKRHNYNILRVTTNFPVPTLLLYQ